jgi:hypothetical protein
MSLNIIEKYRLKQLQKKIIKWENRQKLIKDYLKEWRKEAKKLLIKETNIPENVEP